MAYTALYRKFRPTTFSNIVGQEAITKTLKNQIIAERVGHAYLLNGGRGTGKTTTAKILARAINCLNPQNGEPCNECEICKAALSGSLTDIVEMDAASNNSVEDIRAIRDEVNFLPTIAKYRVYIIDEVHMLSVGAFNALLKTLEEPPSHVKFILATTEPQKLPATILSRCQRFDFTRLKEEDIIKGLNTVCNQSNIDITEKALKLIAILAEGAMRDALSILERCMQDGDYKIDEEKIKELAGIPKLDTIIDVAKSIIEYNVEQAINASNIVIDSGKDLNYFLWELIRYFKDILVYKSGGKLDLYTKQELDEIEILSKNTEKNRLLSIIYDLSELANELKWSSQRTLLFQVGVMKLCYLKETQDLEVRIEKIENVLKSGVTINKTKEQKVQSNEIKEEKSKVQINQSVPVQNVAKNTNQKPVEYWPKVLNELKTSGKMMLYSNLVNTTAKQENDLVVQIEFSKGMTPFGMSVLNKPENIAEVTKLVSMQCGKDMKIKYIDINEPKAQKEETQTIESLANELDVPINLVEE